MKKILPLILVITLLASCGYYPDVEKETSEYDCTKQTVEKETSEYDCTKPTYVVDTVTEQEPIQTEAPCYIVTGKSYDTEPIITEPEITDVWVGYTDNEMRWLTCKATNTNENTTIDFDVTFTFWKDGEVVYAPTLFAINVAPYETRFIASNWEIPTDYDKLTYSFDFVTASTHERINVAYSFEEAAADYVTLMIGEIPKDCYLVESIFVWYSVDDEPVAISDHTYSESYETYKHKCGCDFDRYEYYVIACR